ncbi:hypothetical protein ABZY45_26045 [Streptomyces sp. NPDC006516]|uniref:hypothetical protein n=1 Tax=Streptomyces sp. NPDC006516 TaxID=3154309 RepID=UPI0033B72DA0
MTRVAKSVAGGGAPHSWSDAAVGVHMALVPMFVGCVLIVGCLAVLTAPSRRTPKVREAVGPMPETGSGGMLPYADRG